MAENAYGGRLPDEPIENACDTRKRGDMPKTFVKSARRPVNIKLDSMTSFCTSLAMLSTVPGLGRLSNALRSENELYASLIAAAAGFSVRNERDDVRSAILDVEGFKMREDERCRHAMPTSGFRCGSRTTSGQGEGGKIETSPGNLGRSNVSDHVNLQE